MAEYLFIQPEEIVSTTVMGGNVDLDKYVFCIADTQLSVIEPLLGTELYDKILSDAENDTLAGLYLTLYTEYVKPITKNEATSKYIEISPYSLTNGGLFKHQPDNAEIASVAEVNFLAEKYAAMAQMYVQRFEKWICKNTIPEYKRAQDDVNAMDIKLTNGLYFGGRVGLIEDELW